MGKGLDSGQFYEPVLAPSQLASLKISSEQPPFDGDPMKFRLGVEFCLFLRLLDDDVGTEEHACARRHLGYARRRRTFGVVGG